jgi:dephospho-CoA kinase
LFQGSNTCGRVAFASAILDLMKIIGLTGVIGSGKSTVAGFLKELGAAVINADEVAHQVYAPGTPGWQQVVSTFGSGILNPDASIDRRKLGQIVFTNSEALARLNRIIHPLVEQKVRALLDDYRNQGVRVTVIEAALLIEAGWVPLMDELWVTTAPREVIWRRLKARDSAARRQVLARLRSQLPVIQQRRMATRMIETNTDLDKLRRKIARLWRKTVAELPGPAKGAFNR